MPKSAATVRVGTSGWEYRHWSGRFYPADLPKSRWLEHYAAEFDTVELNNSFYRLPEADAFVAWRHRLPSGFMMAVKASRYLTHLKRLRDPDEPLGRFWSRATKLGDRLGPVFYQLPPRWGRNVERLSAFCAAAPRRRPQAVEFRDPSWYGDETDAVLAEADFAICLHDMRGSERAERPVGPFVYVRFHGSGARYGGAYPAQRLTAWADRLAAWARDGLPGWVYFNNDLEGHAVRDALRLREYLARRGVA